MWKKICQAKANVARINEGGLGVTEVVDYVVFHDAPAFFDIVNSEGEPLPLTTVDLYLSLEAYSPEVEPNDSSDTSQTLLLPETVAATLAVSDQDWYTFTANSSAVLQAETLGTSELASLDTRLFLYGDDGVTQLAQDDDGGEGTFSQIVYDIPEAGTYFMVVEAGDGPAEGEYLLTVDATIR